MKRIPNNKSVELPFIHEKLKKQLTQYKYELRDDVIIVTKSDDIKVNILANEDYIFMVEAVPPLARLIPMVVVFGFLVVFTQTQGWQWGWRIPLFIVGYFVGGLLGDALYRQMKRHGFGDINKDLETELSSLNQ